jgi:hypothetical protein
MVNIWWFPPTKCNPWSYLDQHEYDDVEGLVTAKDKIIRFASHSKHIWMPTNLYFFISIFISISTIYKDTN